MNDVFERLRDIPEPPLRPSAEVLATARRDSKRRTALRAAAGGLATLAVLGGAAVAVDRLQPPPPAPQAAAALPRPSATTAPPPVPAPEAVDKQSPKIARALIAAVPIGYAAAPVQPPGEKESAYSVKVAIGKGGYRAVTLVRITEQRGSGVVAAVFGTDLPIPTAQADLCGAHQDLGIEGATITGCETVDTGGAVVRVVRGTDPGTGDVMSALRFLDGGYLVVSASQGMRAYRVSPEGDAWTWEVAVNPRHEKALAALPFTAAQLAALTVDPALIP